MERASFVSSIVVCVVCRSFRGAYFLAARARTACAPARDYTPAAKWLLNWFCSCERFMGALWSFAVVVLVWCGGRMAGNIRLRHLFCDSTHAAAAAVASLMDGRGLEYTLCALKLKIPLSAKSTARQRVCCSICVSSTLYLHANF